MSVSSRLEPSEPVSVTVTESGMNGSRPSPCQTLTTSTSETGVTNSLVTVNPLSASPVTCGVKCSTGSSSTVYVISEPSSAMTGRSSREAVQPESAVSVSCRSEPSEPRTCTVTWSGM